MIVVIDDFIKDQSLLDEIKSDSGFFEETGTYFFWKGWWDSPANSLKKRLIKYIWGDHPPLSKIFTIAGFEYWTGITTSDQQSPFLDNLDTHFDKDEEYFQKTGELQSPIIGTVYYPPQDEFVGGMLEIFSEGLDKEPERIYAKPNRLINFDAGKDPYRVSKVIEGTRKAIAINLWEYVPYSEINGKLKKEI